jgi:hypothetical protein
MEFIPCQHFLVYSKKTFSGCIREVISQRGSHVLRSLLGKERNELIRMGGEGGTKALPETVETSQLGSHGSGHETAEQGKDFQLAMENQKFCTINQVDMLKDQ